MEELKIKVTKMTADTLRKTAGEMGVPIGEVVDRYVLRVAPDDPQNAIVLAIEHYLVCVSRLSKEDAAQVFGDICGIFLGAIPPEELDKMVVSIKSTRNWEDPAIGPVTEEEKAAFRKAVDEMVQAAKDEYIRNVFRGLLHG